MSDTFVISTRALGRKQRLLDDWSIPLPPESGDGGEPFTLRQLITRVVLAEVEAFHERQEARKFLRVLSEREIAEAAERGRIEMGDRDLRQVVDPGEAVATALIGFEDGLYLVSIDGHEQRDLEAEIYLQPESRVTFIRLVLLAGG